LVSCFLVIFIAISQALVPKWHEIESSSYNFEQYCRDFHKRYTDDMYSIRKAIFKQRLNEYKIHNLDTTKSWKKGINHLTDQTDCEIKKLLGGVVSDLSSRNFIDAENLEKLNSQPVKGFRRVDWREKGIITPVKDQGRCGSCWSFGAAETLESYFALYNPGQLTILSQQQILDCTPNPNKCGGSGGCNGGTAELAYRQIINLGGLSTEWAYPYTSYYGDSSMCNYTYRVKPIAKIVGYVNLPSNDAQPIIQHLNNHGPLVINVDASTWSSYETGVFDGCNQTNPDINHVVQLVGMGSDPDYGDYWLVRNSWTPFWGENGYIRVRRTIKPRCGVDLTPQDGIGCNGGNKTVIVCGTCGVTYDAVYPVVGDF